MLSTLHSAQSSRLFRGLTAGSLAALAFATYTKSAHAQAVEPSSFPLERFRIAMDRNGILGAEWAEVPGHLSWDGSIWLGLSDDPLALYNADGDRVAELVHRRWTGNVTASISLWNRIQLGIEVPLILAQSRDNNQAIFGGGGAGSISGFSFGDLRFIPKISLLKQSHHGIGLALIPSLTVPTGGDEYRGDDGLTFAPELALSRSQGALRLALNAGYRFRPESTLADLSVDDEIFGRLGIGYRITDTVEADVGASFATASKSILGTSNTNHSEALAGLTFDLPGPLVVSAIGGLGITNGFGTPDWRAVLALRLDGSKKTSVGDRDGDGITDDKDKCPDQPEDKDGFQDEDGCPDNDNDGDGMVDIKDTCPDQVETVNNFQDEDGCPDESADTDGDGLADSVDKCPTDAEDKDGFDDEDGCPDLDNDNDQILDTDDICPMEAGVAANNGCPDKDTDGDTLVDRIDNCPDVAGPLENRGCPDTDRDGDTVVDRLDNCPDEAGLPKNQGCKAKQQVVITTGGFEITESVFFKNNKDVIEKKSYKLLRNVAAVLKNHTEVTSVTVEGHTDDQGDDAYNKDLSQRRAEAVRTFLIGEGVEAGRLDAKGYGEERPVAANSSKAGRAKNRRVEFKINGAVGDIRDATTGPGSEP